MYVSMLRVQKKFAYQQQFLDVAKESIFGMNNHFVCKFIFRSAKALYRPKIREKERGVDEVGWFSRFS